MSLPPSYDAWRTRHPDEDVEPHDPSCPMSDDYDGEISGIVDMCRCPSAKELKAEAAEAKADAAREG